VNDLFILMGSDSEAPDPKGSRLHDLQDRLRAKVRRSRDFLRKGGKQVLSRSKEIREMDSIERSELIRSSRAKIRRELREMGVVGLLTRFPLVVVIACIVSSAFFAYQAGAMTQWAGVGDKALNVNGDLDAYLPEGQGEEGEVARQLAAIESESGWTTNVMIVYVESETINVTSESIMREIDLVEQQINPHIDDPYSDDAIYVLSISTVVKELNSSLPRVTKAILDESLRELPLGSDASKLIAEQIAANEDLLGSYRIPSETRISQIVDQLPENALDYLVRDTRPVGEPDGVWDRAVIIVGVAENRPADEVIEYTSGILSELSEERGWKEMGLSMTLTGPVPITSAVTESIVSSFWSVFPLTGIAVCFGLFLFHSDFIQTFRVRALQGIKVVVITGLPTLCAVFWTLGIVGYFGVQVTMTVIIVGPILLALGVSYGLHITNRYAEESGTREEKMAVALSSTGRAVMLSALTTLIGFFSLTFTPLAPIRTIGFILSGGIVVVYLLTMVMVPNLTMLLDLDKPKHETPRVFTAVVSVPTQRPGIVLLIFGILLAGSAIWAQPAIERNIDLLKMAPPDEQAVAKMGEYSNDFNAGQIGMILCEGAVREQPFGGTDPAENLAQIDLLTDRVSSVENTTAIGITFLMKAVGLEANVSGTPIWEIIRDTPGVPSEIKDIAQTVLDQQVNQDTSFWEVLQGLENTESQSFMLNVFYDSLTNETREFFVSKDYTRTLLYVNMPFLPVSETSVAVDDVNRWISYPYGSVNVQDLTGVAAVTIAVNNLIVDSQWTSLGFAVLLTLLTLAIVFRDLRYAVWTTIPVVATVGLQWLVMWGLDITLSLVTVMIGSIVIGVGVDYSIHISNRIRELGGTLEAIEKATVSTGMSLTEATVVTTFGLWTAYMIPIPEVKPFVTVIIVLLIIAASSALVLLPAIFAFLLKFNIGLTGGASAMAKRLGINRRSSIADHSEALLDYSDDGADAW